MIDPTRPNRNIYLLYPKLLDNLILALDHVDQSGMKAYAFETVRFHERQAWLYAQGRTRPGRVITRAKPGYSWHEYGLAVDLVFDASPRDGIQWSWDGDYIGKKEGDYERLGEIMRDHGFEQLITNKGRYYDKPHFQWTYGLGIHEAFLIYQKYGIFGVWEEITNRSNQ